MTACKVEEQFVFLLHAVTLRCGHGRLVTATIALEADDNGSLQNNCIRDIQISQNDVSRGFERVYAESQLERETGVHWSFISYTSPGVDNQAINQSWALRRPHCCLQAMHGHCNVCRGAGGRNTSLHRRFPVET